MKDIFYIVKNFKKNKNSKPVILMGYYNMIYQYGENKFLKKCKKTGVNGLIVVDLPWPDNKIFAKKCKKNSICFVQLLSPTTSKVILSPPFPLLVTLRFHSVLSPGLMVGGSDVVTKDMSNSCLTNKL